MGLVRRLDVSRPARRVVARLPGGRLAEVAPKTMTFLAGAELRRLIPGRKRPTARPSPQYAAQVALDEALLAGIAAGRMPRREEYPRLEAEVVEAARMWEDRGWAADPGSYHVPPPDLLAPLVVPARSRGIRFERLTFESGYAPHEGEPGGARWLARESNRVAHAWVLRHRGAPRPWAVCVHGMGMGMPIADLSVFKRLYAERGLNVLMPVLPAHGPRRLPGARIPDVPGADLLDVVHLLAQAVWDIRRLIGWLDAPAVGAYGISLGGYVVSLLATHEPGLAAVIAGVPVVDFEALTRHHATPGQRAKAASYRLVGDEARRVLSVVSPLTRPPLGDPVLGVFAGLGDRIATPAQADLLWEHWGRPPRCWYAGGHIGFMWSARAAAYIDSRLEAAGLVT